MAAERTMKTAVQAFLQAAKKGGVGVVGASANRDKFGNKVLRAYLTNEYTAHPVNPRGGTIEAVAAVKDVSALPAGIPCLSVITPPKFADAVVAAAHKHGVQHVWFQPGADSETAVKAAAGHGINVISGGACVLVELGFEH